MTPQNRTIPHLNRAFRAEMARHGLPRADSHILVAFSGGADSTALLHLVYTLVQAQRQKPRITALHVNHGIRGNEAARDAKFCRCFCETYGIPFVLYEADAPAEASQCSLTLEEAARNLRYRLIKNHLAAHPDITCVLTAHHADDQAETVLFRLLRGTALRGISGIPDMRLLSLPDSTRKVPLIRPLLSFTKQQLTAYLSDHGIGYVTDSTNAENDATRNLLRNTLIPAAQSVNPAFTDALLRLSAQAEEDEAYFSTLIDAFFNENGITPTDPIPAQLLSAQSIPVRRRILAAIYDAHIIRYPHWKPLSRKTLDAMLHALNTASRTALSSGFVFTASDGICRIGKTAETLSPEPYHIPLSPGVVTPIPTGGSCLLCDGSVKASENLQDLKNIYKFFISTHINSDKLLDSVYLRPRADNASDRYLCGGSCKTAKDALSAHRVPTAQRKTIPLFCDGEGIVWIPFCGIRDSVNPRLSDRNCAIADLYYFYNDEVTVYASRY
ncbi:MAG: tRNA lysidine(34) synthetase TilS [Ruminococcaceae bacterium]|nr:tRNA lysidine(34) synthetase TilS [Oscillospiraceae bacterium]